MSTPLTTSEDDDVDYEDEDETRAPFLKHDDHDTPIPRKQPTPLPVRQFLALLSLWLAESIVEHSISPYLNQLVRDLPIVGGDGQKVGYYTGILVSVHHVAEALTAFHWNRLSDHVGRKPVLLSCLAGTILSTISFGLSRSFLALVLSRGLHGALKGSIGIVKCMTAELTDETNIARGFSLLPMTWAFGYVIGPFIGGILSRPQDRWPRAFSHAFWANYPYFLPCLVASCYACVSLVIVAKFLEETVMVRSSSVNLNALREEPSDNPDLPLTDAEKPLPLRHLLTKKPVLISLANYAMDALLGMVAAALLPLIWSTPVEFGGLDMSPARIGVWLSVYGCMNGMFQFAVFPRAVARFGPRSVFVTGIAMFAVVYAMFPFENLLRRTAVDHAWPLILVQLTALSISKMSYSEPLFCDKMTLPGCASTLITAAVLPGAVFMYLSSAAPNRRSLGATNGFAQSVASIQRTFGPAFADWLFAFSIANNVLGGNLVYIVLLALVCGGLYVATHLPRQMWVHDEGWIPLRSTDSDRE